MALSRREQTVAIVSGALAAYSLRREMGSLPTDVTPFSFVLRVVPKEMKGEITAKLIDDIFEYVSAELRA